MSDELTDWFPPEETPVHVGEYNASAGRDPKMFRWWDGHQWSAFYEADYTKSEVATCRSIKTTHKYPWRGLKRNPNDKRS